MQTQVDIEQLKDVFKSLFTKNVFGDPCVRTHNGVPRLMSERTTRKVKKFLKNHPWLDEVIK